MMRLRPSADSDDVLLILVLWNRRGLTSALICTHHATKNHLDTPSIRVGRRQTGPHLEPVAGRLPGFIGIENAQFWDLHRLP